MAFKGLWKRLYIPWKQQSCSFLDFLQCFKVPNLLFSPLPRQNNFTFVVSCSLTWLQAATSIYQIWQPEVGTNFFFSNLGKVRLHHDQQVLLKTKAWIYSWLCSDAATGTASTSWTALSSVPDHSRGGGTFRLMVWGQTSSDHHFQF